MQKTSKILSLAVAMFAIAGMVTFSGSLAYAGNGAGGVGKMDTN